VRSILRWHSVVARRCPELPPCGAAAVGFLGYGVSLVLFVLGLRHLGTARTVLTSRRLPHWRGSCAPAIWRAADLSPHRRGAAHGDRCLSAPRRDTCCTDRQPAKSAPAPTVHGRRTSPAAKLEHRLSKRQQWPLGALPPFGSRAQRVPITRLYGAISASTKAR